jgi:arylsulfatase A-like enzyme
MTSPKRPNILLIMSDNQSADYLGCYGNDEVKTPAIDRLAAKGTIYDNAYCVNAMCSPCRASVLTGMMPSGHGVHTWLDDGLADTWPKNWNAIGEFENLPTRFSAAGYNTALIGKYHLGHTQTPPDGFYHWVTFPHGHTVSFYGNHMIDNDKSYDHAGHSVDYFADKTVEYIAGQADSEDPFFCFVPFNGPYGHWPAIKGRAANKFAADYDDCPLHSVPREGVSKAIVDRYTLRVVEAGAAPHERFAGPILLPNDTDSLKNYFSQISLIDEAVARILRQLDASGQLDNTIVIYTADHGFSLGHHGVWGHGLAAWPSSMHRPSYNIPLIIAGPGIAAAHSSQLVSQTDLANSLLVMAGLEPLSNPLADSQIIDFTDPANPHRDAVFIEQEESRAIRTATHLYVERFSHSACPDLAIELYDLNADPDERVNIANDPAAGDICSALSARLTAYFAQYANPAHDLWQGGKAKSNITNTKYWQAAWGDDWACIT